MSKRKNTPHQSSLFKHEIPHMPEGYYSSGPNPNLRRFVEEHATPYDPLADDYHVPPFDQPITTTKATAIYNMHTYWSKKPHDAIRQYIAHYTQPGDLVLDPFCGSGGTALAALMEGRAAVAIDLSPAATFITKNYCTPVDVDALQRAFEELEAKVKPEMDWLYETCCDRCDGRATTAYTVYSYVFQCPRCLEKVALFDCVEVEGEKGKPIHACPHCHERGIVEEISTRGPRWEPVPVLVSYLCQEGCHPQRGERRHNDADEKKRAFFQQYDLGKLAEIAARSIPHWTPPQRMMNVESDTAPWGDKWRAGTSSFRTVRELFTRRNLWALGAIREAAETSDSLLFCLTGITLNNSTMVRESNTQFLAGTYYIPQISKAVNTWGSFSGRVAQLLKYGEMPDSTISSSNCIISTQSATHLENIRSCSIDYIFTDPPYADKVQYGELNFIWEAWLDFDTHWHEQEIIVNTTRSKTDTDWARMMRQAMDECYRVLKPGRWMSLCYHDTSEGTWQLVQDLMAEVGFIPDRAAKTLFIDKAEKSYNQYTAEKVTKRDLVINFRKPRADELATQLTLDFEQDQATFADKARLILREALDAHPGTPADRLYDELVSRMVRRGEFERHNFDELLRSVAEEVVSPPSQGGAGGGSRWYLLETADQVDEAESAKEAAAAARMEAYINQVFSVSEATKPGLSGIHYSDLFEQYLPVPDKPRRLLADWLPEFFFRTPEGTWRPPANDEERAQKQALRMGGALRQIKRFARALSEGVPPHERDCPENTATAADWIRQCRRAGLYEIGRALYEKGGFDFGQLDEIGTTEVEEDYQVCVRRSG